MVEKVTAEYQQYGQEIGAPAKQYTMHDPDRLQQGHEQRNISITPKGEELRAWLLRTTQTQ
jgi:hypothetical protein